MKRIRTIVALVTVIVMMLSLAGCGGGASGLKKGAEFDLGDNTYMFEGASAEGTEVTVHLLIKGDGAPVVIRNNQLQTAVMVKLGDGDNTITPSTVSFNAADDAAGYGSRVSFTFEVPEGTDVPKTATAINGFDENDTVQLDLGSAL